MGRRAVWHRWCRRRLGDWWMVEFGGERLLFRSSLLNGFRRRLAVQKLLLPQKNPLERRNRIVMLAAASSERR